VPCPTPEQLDALFAEALGPIEQAALEDHVQGCPACQEQLARLADDPHAARWRQLHQSSPAADTPLPTAVKDLPSPPGWETPQDGAAGPPADDLPAFDDYEILGEVGRGGMGVVYKARQKSLNRLVALKVILDGAHASREGRARFRREAEAIARLQHPNIVQIHEVGEQHGLPYLCLEYLDGGTLAARLDGKPLPVRTAAELVRTLALAVHYAHERGVLHRDLKPANILLHNDECLMTNDERSPNDEARTPQREAGLGPSAFGLRHSFVIGHSSFVIPKITDFGLAKQLDDPGPQTSSNQVVGTPTHMAPEQVRRRGTSPGPAVDVWALGVILYELLTGRVPFRGKDPMDTILQVLEHEPVRPGRLQPSVPADVETICLKCLAKEPARRYATAGALADDLQRFLDGRPVRARPLGRAGRAWRWCRRNPGVAGLVAALVAVLLAGAASLFFGLRAVEPGARQEERQAPTAVVSDEAEDQLYGSRLAQAQLAWQANTVAGGERLLADALLDECRPAEGQRDRRGWEWHYLKRLCQADLLPTLGHAGSWSFGVAFSRDGQRLLSAGGGDSFFANPGREVTPGEVVLWDAADGQGVRSLQGHAHLVVGVAVSPDGTRLASASLDRTVKVWETATGREVRTLRGHPAGVTAVAFSPDGRALAAATGNDVWLWDLASGQHRVTLRGHTGAVTALAFSPDGRRVLTGSEDGGVRWWDPTSGQPGLQPKAVDLGRVRAVACSPDGQQVAAAGDGGIRVFQAQTGQLALALPGHGGRVTCAAFTPDGRDLASGGDDALVRLWRVAGGRELRTLRGHVRGVTGLAFRPDGAVLVSGSSDGRVRLWDVTRPPECVVLGEGGTHDVEGLGFRAAGREIAVADFTASQLLSLDAVTGTVLRRRLVDLTANWATPAVRAVLTPDGRCLAAIPRGDRFAVKLTDLETGRELATFRGHVGLLRVLAPSRDSRLLACGGSARWKEKAGVLAEVKIWELPGPDRPPSADAPAPQPLRTLRIEGFVVDSLAFSPDAAWLAVGGLEPDPPPKQDLGQGTAVVKVFAVATGDEVFGFRGEPDRMAGLTFDATGRQLAAVGVSHGTILLWDLATGRQIHSQAGPPTAVGVDFSPDGRRLVIAGRTQMKILDTATGRELVTLRPPVPASAGTGLTPMVRFSPDGERLVAMMGHPGVSVWEAGELTPEAQSARRQAVERRRFDWHLEQAKECTRERAEFALGFHLDRLQEREPPGLAARLERGERLVEGGRLEQAHADFARAFEQGPPEETLDGVLSFACLRLQRGDQAGYRRLRAGLVEHFAGTANSRVAREVIRTAALAPWEDQERAALLALVGVLEGRATQERGLAGPLGLGYFRGGRLDPARQRLQEAVNAFPDDAPPLWPVLALVHHGLGQTEEARRWLTQASQWQEAALRELARPPDAAGPLPVRRDWLAFRVLYREAQAALRP
jgi:eukaryotic-like serine/threonine-protein kinase